MSNSNCQVDYDRYESLDPLQRVIFQKGFAIQTQKGSNELIEASNIDNFKDGIILPINDIHLDFTHCTLETSKELQELIAWVRAHPDEALPDSDELIMDPLWYGYLKIPICFQICLKDGIWIAKLEEFDLIATAETFTELRNEAEEEFLFLAQDVNDDDDKLTKQMQLIKRKMREYIDYEQL